ncbi:MAG: ATP-binding cassette domain-containing protein [Chloroflexi bacterium]|nr:MAG: ATP-binding cassette domain-containing protein [Chloroflexota bacterium]
MLEVHELNVAYGDAQALWDVSLHVDDGEIVTIVGPNGAGKTTLVNCLSGIIAAKSGAIMFDGHNLCDTPSHRVCGHGVVIVPEGRRIFPKMSVRHNLDLGAFTPEARAHHNDMLEYVYSLFPILQERETQLAGTLSGGQQQMLAIGRALMARPKLLLLDEPSLGLAPVIVDTIFDVIHEINKDGMAVLMVEQNVVKALEAANRGYVLEEGRIVQTGDARELLGDKRIKQAYLGLSGFDDDVDSSVRIYSDVTDIVPEGMPDLTEEEVFMTLIRLVETDEVPPDVQEVFRSGEEKYGQVLNTWRAIAHNPEIFKAYLPYILAIFKPAALDQRTKELCALYVAILNHCRYTTAHRVASCRRNNIPEADMIGLLNIEGHNFSSSEVAALHFAEELTLNTDDISYRENKQAVSEATLSALKKHFNDAEISELSTTVALWNSLSRFHRVMDFELDMPAPPPEIDAAL